MRMHKESGIAPLEHFARCLRNYWRCIVSRVRWPMHTGQLEGINNRIKVIKRMAYGYRDTDYFFLKIKGRLPRKCVMNQKKAPLGGAFPRRRRGVRSVSARHFLQHFQANLALGNLAQW